MVHGLNHTRSGGPAPGRSSGSAGELRPCAGAADAAATRVRPLHRGEDMVIERMPEEPPETLLDLGDIAVSGTLQVPDFEMPGGAAVRACALPEAPGLVILPHTGGGERGGPRNRRLAQALRRHGVITYLV